MSHPIDQNAMNSNQMTCCQNENARAMVKCLTNARSWRRSPNAAAIRMHRERERARTQEREREREDKDKRVRRNETIYIDEGNERHI